MGIREEWLNANQVAKVLGITRQAVGNFHRASQKSTYRGGFPKAAHTDPLGGKPMWTKKQIDKYMSSS